MTRLLSDSETRLFDEHRGLALGWAFAYTKRLPSHVDHDDIRQDALVGLTRACQSYDPARSAFTSYAYRRVLGEILDGLRRRDWVPRSVSAADRLNAVSLEDRWQVAGQDGEETTIGAYLADQHGPDPAPLALVSERDRELRSLVAALPARERYVLAAYYWRGETLREIGVTLGVTESRVSQLRSKAVGRLRRPMRRLAA